MGEVWRQPQAQRTAQRGQRADRLDYYVSLYGRRVAHILLAHREGAVNDVCTWREMARRRGHAWQWYCDPEEGPGEFVSCEPETGCIRVNFAYGPETQARAAIHELSHAELNRIYLRLPPHPRMGYGVSAEELQHAICRRVESLVLGDFVLGDFPLEKPNTLMVTNSTEDGNKTKTRQPFEDFAAALGFGSGDLPLAHRELIDLIRQQTELWQSQVDLAQSQVELAQTQTEIFRGMVEAMLSGKEAAGDAEA